MAEVWRVVLRDGSVREASVEPATAYGYMAPESATHGWRATRVGEGDTVHAAPEAMGGDAADAVTRLAAHNGWPVREILAPGEPTRAEAVAFERGRDAVDEAGARAMRAAALRDAVAAERERCARWCDEVAAERRERLRALESEGISPHDPARLALVVAITDAERCAAKIRAGGV